ncbi:MAG: thioesterase family protein [Burkholderiaceae bacterium]|nr:thioesterase family protein [Burkholderiaceae bacterium]
MSTDNQPQPRPQPEQRGAYAMFRRISTRWADNDAYGHVNNVVYYAWFDSAVNAHLIEQGALDIHQGATIGLVVETHCNYFSPVVFPQPVEIGIRVASMGGSSVRYELGVFIANTADPAGLFDVCAAKGHFIHVYVDQQTRRPVPLPLPLKSVLEKLTHVKNV